MALKFNRPFGGEEKPILYLVGTPIGNIGDFSVRAREILTEADLVVCEDTRMTASLLEKLKLPMKKLVSCYSQKEEEKGRKIVAHMKEEKLMAAFVSDAGMPGISDPGALLAQIALEEGIPVSTIPGPTAFVSALVASGFDTADFSFYGFLPVKSSARKKLLSTLKDRPETLIFYEAPHRFTEMMEDLRDSFGEDRRVSVSRELTKIHEENIYGTLGEICSSFDNLTLKGEFVIVVEGHKKEEKAFDEKTVLEEAKKMLESGEKKTKIAKILAAEYSVPKDTVYILIKDL
jgi:16S rRNA (cytidine1402-2'-O)-methyltransferase